jgi:hypothetical protein
MLCLLVADNVSAMTSIANAAVRTVARRVPTMGVLGAWTLRLRADVVIATEEAFGPRDHFVAPRVLTPEEEALEEALRRRRLELGLSSSPAKR